MNSNIEQNVIIKNHDLAGSTPKGINGTVQLPDLSTWDSVTIIVRRWGHVASQTISKLMITSGLTGAVYFFWNDTNNTKLSISATGLITVLATNNDVYIDAITYKH